MKWRIYYDTGSTHDYNNGVIPDAYGVVAILQLRHDGRYYITHGAPYYIHNEAEWLPAYMNDVEDYLAHKIPIKEFLVGRIVSKRVFAEIFERAKKDRDIETLD
ncbi:MAG: hypothetical protein KAJ93_08780 [Methanosarcinales archaeon]|nr:hypothetical protein [Methanosarcinales archaeon]